MMRLLIALQILVGLAFGQNTYVSACSTNVIFNFASGVTAAQQSMIHDSTIAGVEYICRKTGYGVAQFQVFVSPNNDDLIQDLVSVFGYPADSAGPPPMCATSPLGGILINVSNSSCWNWTGVDIKTRVAKTMAHEYFHQVQRRLVKLTSPFESTGPDGVPLKGPGWLIEGSAELVGLMALDDAGLRSFPDTITQWEIPALITDSFQLSSQEKLWSPPAQNDPYTYVAAAVDLLTAGAPAKTAWLAGFWDAIGKGMPWRQSFQRSFGISAADFYAQFDSYAAPFRTQVLSLAFTGIESPLPNSSLGGGTGVSVPYSFSILGTRLSDYPGSQIMDLLRLPPGNSGWGSSTGSQITVYMQPDAPSGNYTFGMSLPDGRSASVSFPVIQASIVNVPQPLITGIAPNVAVQGNIGTSLDISGSGFVPGSALVLNGLSTATQVLSGSKLRGNISGARLLSGPLSVQVSNSGVGGSTSATASLPVNDPHVIDIDQTTAMFKSSGSTGRVPITAAAGNDFWAVSTVSPWITIDSVTTGTGSGSVDYKVAPNTAVASRIGSINIGGRILTVKQDSADSTLPSISAGGVVSSAAFTSPVAPGSFVTIYGSNFAGLTLTWDTAIVGGIALPTALAGISVKINGKDCFISYASPSQINVLTPPDTAVGMVLVEVTTPKGVATAVVSMASIVPAFFTVPAAGSLLPVAVFADDGSLAAPPGSIPGVSTRPAKPGDNLLLFAEGLGPTAVPYPVGQVLTMSYPVADLSQFTVVFGGVATAPQFVGLTFAGVYQINVQVPKSVSEGLQTVVLKMEGQTSQPNLVLPFSN